MHSLGVAFIDPESTDIRGQITRLMAPYHCEIEVTPYKAFHSHEDAMKLARHHGASNLEELVRILTRKGYDDIGIEAGHFYRISTYNPKAKWDYWQIGGNFEGLTLTCIESERDWDEDLLANMCEVKFWPYDLVPAVMVEPDGNWHDNADFSTWETWENHVQELMAWYSGHLAVILDIHS